MNEDDGSYLLDIMLDCPDNIARTHVGALLKFILNRLKIIEKDHLYDTESC